MKQLFIHQWKEKIRSTFWQKSIFVNILLGIFGLYLLLNMVIISLFADKIIFGIYGECNVVEVFTSMLFYYFLFDLVFRFLFQQLPTLSIQPYMILPIKKSELLHYPLLKTIPSFFNMVALLLFIPFYIKIVVPTETAAYSLVWITTVVSMIALNNFLNFSFKKYFLKSPLLIVLLIAIAVLLFYLDFSDIMTVSAYFSSAISFMSKNILLVIIPILLAAFSYYLAFTLLKKNAYIEEIQNKADRKIAGFSFLSHFGEMGQLINVEIKMILRNKRPKSLLYISALIGLYGLLLYRGKNLDNTVSLSVMGFLCSSIFTLNYGQFLFSWESSFFDFYLANKISAYNYIKSKYLFLAFASIISFFLTLPYAFIDYKIAFINAAFLFYNIGISSVILLFLCTFNSSYIDLGKSQFMNYQGSGILQFLIVIPLMGIPVLLFYILKISGLAGNNYFFYAIGIVGVAGIIFNKFLLQVVANQLIRRKYAMALGFRQK